MSETRSILRFTDGRWSNCEDHLAAEEPLEIRVRGRAISITMRTPGHDDELAAGFLLSEGLIRSACDIAKIDPCERNEHGNLINVQLAPEVPVDFEKLTRHVFASSSCGLCGKASIEAIATQFPPLQAPHEPLVDANTILALPERMRADQAEFDRSGGLHAAALFDTTGKLLVLREDVGRHNAVDKVLGHALLNNRLPLDRHVLLVSGRVSFEIVQKALAARIPIIAAVSAPSSLAVDFCRRCGQTLAGFVRDRRMNLYAHGGRIRGTAESRSLRPD